MLLFAAVIASFGGCYCFFLQLLLLLLAAIIASFCGCYCFLCMPARTVTLGMLLISSFRYSLYCHGSKIINCISTTIETNHFRSNLRLLLLLKHPKDHFHPLACKFNKIWSLEGRCVAMECKGSEQRHVLHSVRQNLRSSAQTRFHQ